MTSDQPRSDTRQAGPDGLIPRQRRALRSVAVLFWMNGMVVASYVPRLPGIRDRLDLDLATVGIVLALATGAGLLGSLGVGPAVERWPTRTVMIGGALALTFTLPLVAVAPNALVLLSILTVLSIADVFTDVAMNIQGSALSSRRRVPVMQRLHAMWSLGTVIGGLAATAMAALDVALGIHLLVASAVLLCTLLYVGPGLLEADGPSTESPGHGGPKGSATGVALLFAALGAAAIVPEMINSDWAAFRLTDDLDASDGIAGLGYVAFTVGMVAGRLAGDVAVHRAGHQRVLKRASAVAGVGILVATLIPWTITVYVGLLAAGIGVSIMFPELYDAAARHPRPGRALGGLTAGSRISLLGAPLLVGILADTDRFTVGAAIALATIPCVLVVLWLSGRLVEPARAGS
ncbi:MAG: MFS transporter [Acidimicrobiales bacterium]|nr:MFS transporter [Acidimicrobiales bacterium]